MKSMPIPKQIQTILDALTDKMQEILTDNLVGIYVHGSLAMGSFNPVSSDIDLLIVVKNELSVDIKKTIGRVFVELSKGIPSKGFEMSVVRQNVLSYFEYPTPYELHFSYEQKEAFASNMVDYETKNKDPDLAAHFVITKARGVCLYGVPIANLFPEIPKRHYLQSIAHDAEWNYYNVQKGPNDGTCRVPVYAVLNFCRVLAFIDQGLITSKAEGGEWGLKHLPKKYLALITEALGEYKEDGTAKEVDAKTLKNFAQYSWEVISQALNKI